MSALEFLVNHAEWTFPLCLLVSLSVWRLVKADRVITEAEQYATARKRAGTVQ